MKPLLCNSAILVLLVAMSATAQPLKHPESILNHVYPAGARQGQTVDVEFDGLSGLSNATGIHVEGGPGLTVREVRAPKGGKSAMVRATLVIAPDAPPGRRLLRVKGGAGGLTNSRPFFVSRLPEVIEREPNNTSDTAQEITLPVVVNGRIDPALDTDCYAFRLKTGERIVASVMAHGMDSLLRGGKLGGFLDTSLELLDDKGRVVASAEDTIGLDPVLSYTARTEGRHVLRVQSLFFKGSPSAVYRLTVGDVPCPTHVFPPGGQRGTKTEVEFQGQNMPANARQSVSIPADGSPWMWLLFDHPLSDGREIPFVVGEHPERIEKEPNNERQQAERLTLPSTVNARIGAVADQDWYRLALKKGQGVLLEITAQRHLRSAVDSLIEVFDAQGAKITENDDGALFGAANPCAHDFQSSDSWLPFVPKQDGEYFFRITDRGDAAGPQAVYRLSVHEWNPDFQLNLWPDAVPIWGAGTSACFLVHMQHWGGLRSDIKLRIEGLPEGWTGSTVNVPASGFGQFVPPVGFQALMSITAPPTAARGTVVPFRVVGRAEQGGGVIERVAQPMSHYGGGPSKRMHLRYTPQAWAAVGTPMGVRLESSAKDLTVRLGETIQVPVRIHRQPGDKSELAVTIDGPIAGGASCVWRPPFPLKPGQDEVMIPMTLGGKKLPGAYGIVISRSWSSDLRAGRPGPCTPIIPITVLPAK